MTVKNYTTRIDSDKTVGEIEKILVRFGATGIYKEYDQGLVTALMFSIVKNSQTLRFKLPISIEKSKRIIERAVRDRKLSKSYSKDPLCSEQGSRVMWRIVKDWIHVQLSLLEIEFADAVELLLPYIYDPQQNKTLYEKVVDQKYLLTGEN